MNVMQEVTVLLGVSQHGAIAAAVPSCKKELFHHWTQEFFVRFRDARHVSMGTAAVSDEGARNDVVGDGELPLEPRSDTHTRVYWYLCYVAAGR